jgi:hypothetical protein
MIADFPWTAFPQVIPEGAGPVKRIRLVFLLPRRPCWRVEVGAGVKARAEPDRGAAVGLDAGPVRRTLMSCRAGEVGKLLGRARWWAGFSSRPGSGRWSELVLLGHPFGVADARVARRAARWG